MKSMNKWMKGNKKKKKKEECLVGSDNIWLLPKINFTRDIYTQDIALCDDMDDIPPPWNLNSQLS